MFRKKYLYHLLDINHSLSNLCSGSMFSGIITNLSIQVNYLNVTSLLIHIFNLF